MSLCRISPGTQVEDLLQLVSLESGHPMGELKIVTQTGLTLDYTSWDTPLHHIFPPP